MAWDTAFEELMPDSVTVEPWASDNGFGEPVYGTGVTHEACRITYKPTVLRDTNGKELVSSAKIIIGGDASVGPRDRITLPDGTQPKILNVRKIRDEDGPHHEVVFV